MWWTVRAAPSAVCLRSEGEWTGELVPRLHPCVAEGIPAESIPARPNVQALFPGQGGAAVRGKNGGGLRLYRCYDLECAHQLTGGLPDAHRCRRLHGHRYELRIVVSGELDEHGVLIEYGDLDTVILPVLRLADHHSLNTMTERCSTPEAAELAANPTVERFAAWLGTRLEGLIRSARGAGRLRLSRLELAEDSRSGAIWE